MGNHVGPYQASTEREWDNILDHTKHGSGIESQSDRVPSLGRKWELNMVRTKHSTVIRYRGIE